jgi:sugar/nucleoside kinase (ribokinase family)
VVGPSIGGLAGPTGPTVLIVGAATRDVDASDRRGWRLGGTVSYAAMAAARLGARVLALIGVDEQAATAEELDVLRAAGVDVSLVPLERGPLFENTQTATGRHQVVHEVSDLMPVAALPDEWRAAETILLGAVASELGADWAEPFPADSFVGLTWQGLLRELVPGRPVTRLPLSASPLVRRADALALSAEDARAGGPPLRELVRDGQRLLLTHGEFGAAELWFAGDRLHGRAIPPIPRREPLDTTGAGDVFFTAWLVARALHPDLSRPGDARVLAAASAMASLSLTTKSLTDLAGRAELCEVLVRLRDRQLP